MKFLNWIVANYQDMAMALMALISAAEVVVRLTPTKKDDGAMERIGGAVRKIMDKLNIPNVKK